MKITYLEHSGFLVESADCAIIFDYFTGDIPPLPKDIQLYILASHSHRDHFNPEIFSLKEQYPNITYILSSDIRTRETAPIHYIAADESGDFPHFSLRTTDSTDQGVSFLLTLHAGETVFHAGDLNWWTWIGEETEAEGQAMAERFKKEVSKLTPYHIDVAFLPLDPRQQERFYWGFDYYMTHLDIALALPMHFWGDSEVCGRLKALELSHNYRDKIRMLCKNGDSLTTGDSL